MNDDQLKGLTIVAFTQAAAGPIMGSLLSDLGAEVIKIESQRRLDDGRTIPIYAGGVPGPNRALFNIVNRGVKSCIIDLSHPKARDILERLVRISGVVITNYSPRVLESLGLTYEELKTIRSDVILVSVTGYGHVGPERDYLAYAMDADAIGGIAAAFGYPGGEPSQANTYSGDVVAAWYGVVGVLGALYQRGKTGKGEFVDVALTEANATLAPEIMMEYTMNGRFRPPMGNRDEIMAPHGCYPCQGKDTWVTIAVGTDEEFQALCRVMGDPEWARCERFSDQFRRWQNQKELDKFIAGWTKGCSHYEIMHKLQAAGVAAGPSLDIDEVVKDPQIVERRTLIVQDHPEAGKTPVMRAPWASPGPKGTAPLLAEHNDYVFRELLGMSSEEISRLTDEKAVW